MFCAFVNFSCKSRDTDNVGHVNSKLTLISDGIIIDLNPLNEFYLASIEEDTTRLFCVFKSRTKQDKINFILFRKNTSVTVDSIIDSEKFDIFIESLLDDDQYFFYTRELFLATNFFGRNDVKYNIISDSYVYKYVKSIFYLDNIFLFVYEPENNENYCNLGMFNCESKSLFDSIKFF